MKAVSNLLIQENLSIRLAFSQLLFIVYTIVWFGLAFTFAHFTYTYICLCNSEFPTVKQSHQQQQQNHHQNGEYGP